MKNFQFQIELDVRDYECDMQGIVNNSVYQNYFEHTRHKYLKSIGLDFSTLTEKKINLIVIRAEIDYKGSLRSGDSFISSLNMTRVSPLRFGFEQFIYRKSDNVLMTKALVIGTSVNAKGRPQLPEELIKVLGME